MPRRLLIAVIAAIALATLIAYIPALQGGFIWDDDAHVTQNESLKSARGLINIWIKPGSAPQYYPLAHTGFWIQYQLFGEHPLGYKLVNLALHITSSALLLVILLRLGVQRWAAALAACVFALHPVHVESVAWITELKNTLSGALYLGAALTYLRFVDGRDRRWYVAALALFIAALLAKTVTASLPAAMLLVLWWRHGRVTWGDVKPLLPFFAVGVMLGLFTAWFERHFVGAGGEDFSYGLPERLIIAGRAVWFYAGKLVWPHPLVFIYPRWGIDAGAWWQWLYPIAAGGLVAALALNRKRVGVGPLVAALFFGGTLFPALGFIDVFPFVYSFVADHFQYLASLGLIVLLSCAMSQLSNRLPQARPAIIIACVFALAALGASTFAQGYVYRDRTTLWRHVLRHNPQSWMAHNNLGGELLAAGETVQAREHFERSLQLNPRNAGAVRHIAQLHEQAGEIDQAIVHYQHAAALEPANAVTLGQLGQLYLRQGDSRRAKEVFAQAVQLQPRHLIAWYNLGLMALADGDAAEAVRCLRQAVEVQDNLAEPQYQLAQALMQQGDVDEAITHFRAAQSITPDEAPVLLGLGNALAAKGDAAGAIAQFRRAIQLKPDLAEAHYNLGLMLALSKQTDEAIGSLQHAVTLDDEFADAHFNLAILLAQRGQTEKAIEHLRKVVALRPGFAEGYNNLGVLLGSADRPAEAADAYRLAIRIKPDYAEAHNNLGTVLVALNQQDEAIDQFREAVRLTPDDLTARFNLGHTLAAAGRHAEAADMLRGVVKRQPDHIVATVQLARSLQALDRRYEAVAQYARLLKLQPDHIEALHNVAWLMATDPRADATAGVEAIKFADRAYRLSGGDDPQAMDTLAAAYAAAGQFTDAVRIATRARQAAEARDDATLAAAIAQRLQRYRAGQRWTE